MEIHARAAKHGGDRHVAVTEGFLAKLVEIFSMIARRPSQSTRDGFAPRDVRHILRRQRLPNVHGFGCQVHGIVILLRRFDDFPRRDPHVILRIAVEDHHDGFPSIGTGARLSHATEVIHRAVHRHDPSRFIGGLHAFELHHDSISRAEWFVIHLLILGPRQDVLGDVARVQRRHDESTFILLRFHRLRAVLRSRARLTLRVRFIQQQTHEPRARRIHLTVPSTRFFASSVRDAEHRAPLHRSQRVDIDPISRSRFLLHVPRVRL